MGIKDPSKYTWNGAIRNQKVEGQRFGNLAFQWVPLDSDDVQGGTHGYTSRHHDSDVRAPFYHRKRETLDPQGNMEMLYHYEDERLLYEEKQGPLEPHTRKEARADQENNDYQRSRYFLCEKNREEMHPPPDYDWDRHPRRYLQEWKQPKFLHLGIYLNPRQRRMPLRHGQSDWPLHNRVCGLLIRIVTIQILDVKEKKAWTSCLIILRKFLADC